MPIGGDTHTMLLLRLVFEQAALMFGLKPMKDTMEMLKAKETDAQVSLPLIVYIWHDISRQSFC